MLDLAILGALKEGGLHGYELKKRLIDCFGVFSSVSFGSLYPALTRLEKSGAVATEAPRRVRRAPLVEMTGSLGGELRAYQTHRPSTHAVRGRKAKRVYLLTPAGEQLFAELISSDLSNDDERAFNLRLSFARYLSPADRLALLERRHEILSARLRNTRESLLASTEEDHYTHSLMQHSARRLDADLAWLEDLIRNERGVGQTTPPPSPTDSSLQEEIRT